MSTSDCPGYNPKNNDVLSMGSWAEHEDGSMIFVESVENGTVVYSMFDRAQDPIVEYRDAMPENEFKKVFSWNGGNPTKTKRKTKKKVDPLDPNSNEVEVEVPNELWTWHDKTPFPWVQVIHKGAKDGVRYPSAENLFTAADRVAESLKLRAKKLDTKKYGHMLDTTRKGLGSFIKRIGEKLEGLN